MVFEGTYFIPSLCTILHNDDGIRDDVGDYDGKVFVILTMLCYDRFGNMMLVAMTQFMIMFDYDDVGSG